MTSLRPYFALATNTARKVPLLTHTISRMLAEDPLLFIVQGARRLPKQLRTRLTPPSDATPSVPLALAAFVADQPEQARATLHALERTGPGPHQRPHLSRLEAELRIQLGLTTTPGHSAVTNARAAWANGEVDGASFAPNVLRPALAQRFSGEQQVHRVGSGIQLQPRPQAQDVRTTNHNADTVKTDTANTNPVSVFHLLTNSLPWTRSGYTYRTQAVLTAQRATGIDVHAATRLAYPTLIGRPWAARSDTVDGITYQRLEPRRLPRSIDQRLALQAKMFADLVETTDPDVLQTTTNFHNALSLDAVARSSGLPWVYEMRGNMEQSWIARQPAERRQDLLASQRYLRMRDRETEMADRANHLIVLSTTQRKEMVARGIPKSKISIIPNSVDAALLEVPRNPGQAQQELGLPPAFWVGTVTAVVNYEGLPTLLRAVALLRAKGLPVMAAIVGDGVALPGLRTLAADLGIEDAVVLPGRVLPDEALKWYAALEVFTIPRTSTEVTRTVTPMKGLQAMALGVPLVVSDLPALVEVGASSGQGIAVTPDSPTALSDALELLAVDHELRARLSAAGRAAAAKQTWAAAGSTYLNLYEELRSKQTE